MPTIHPAVLAAPGSPADAPDADRFDPDWNLLPDPVKATILGYLELHQLDKLLVNAPPGWGNAPSSAAFDRIARQAILQHEQAVIGGAPPLRDCTYTGQGEVFAAKGRWNAALLVNLCASCARLSSVAPEEATYTYVRGVLSGSRVVPYAGRPGVLILAPGEYPTHALLFADGTIQPLEALRGRQIVSDSGAYRCVLVDSTASGHQGALLVHNPATGEMHACDLRDATLRPLPGDFSIPNTAPGFLRHVLATASGDGRYLAAAFRMVGYTRLVVHDLDAHRNVREMPLPPVVSQLSVDSQGCAVFVAGRHGVEIPPPPATHTRHETLGGALPNYRLTLDERYLITGEPAAPPKADPPADAAPAGAAPADGPGEGNDEGRVTSEPPPLKTRLKHRDDGSHVTLVHRPFSDVAPRIDGVHRLRAIAISPGRLMVATTTNDGTLEVFNLAGAGPDSVVEPALRLQLRGHGALGGFYEAVPWFDADGSGLNAAFTVGDGGGVGLMHLRLA